MNILVTGSNGFIGKNLINKLEENKNNTIIAIDKDNSEVELKDGILKADIIFHLAGVNRPKVEEEFYKGNKDLTEKIVTILKEGNKKTPIIMTSSIQAELNNPYGKSKLLAEESLLKYNVETTGKVIIYRLENVFGKWSRPNYNSAVATFCYNISRNEKVWISDENKEITLVYIDDVIKALVENLQVESIQSGYKEISIKYKKSLGYIVSLIKEFKDSRESLLIPNMKDEFIKKLYSTYLTFIPEEEFNYSLISHTDNRGAFIEVLKSADRGQVSINISKPGITKGNHFHNTKNEKFLVLKGDGIIRFRKVFSNNVIEYKVSGENLEIIDIPPGYTHNITNIGKSEMITLMWVNEVYDSSNPDTTYLEV